MLFEGDLPDRTIAQRLGVDPAAIRTLRWELEADGVPLVRPKRGRPRKGAPSLDAAFLAAVDHVFEFERQGFPSSMSVTVHFTLSFYLHSSDELGHHQYSTDSGDPKNSVNRILKLIGKTRSVAAIALIGRIFGYLGTAEEPPEVIELTDKQKAPKGWQHGARRRDGKWKRIATAPPLWRPASWESCGEFVRHRLLRIEPPAVLMETPDGSFHYRTPTKELLRADQVENRKMGAFLRRTLRATLPLLEANGRDADRMRRLLAMRQSPRRGA
jgi:hypothetical protein